MPADLATVEELALNLRIDDDLSPAETAHFQSLLSAAAESVEQRIGRHLIDKSLTVQGLVPEHPRGPVIVPTRDVRSTAAEATIVFRRLDGSPYAVESPSNIVASPSRGNLLHPGDDGWSFEPHDVYRWCEVTLDVGVATSEVTATMKQSVLLIAADIYDNGDVRDHTERAVGSLLAPLKTYVSI